MPTSASGYVAWDSLPRCDGDSTRRDAQCMPMYPTKDTQRRTDVALACENPAEEMTLLQRRDSRDATLIRRATTLAAHHHRVKFTLSNLDETIAGREILVCFHVFMFP